MRFHSPSKRDLNLLTREACTGEKIPRYSCLAALSLGLMVFTLGQLQSGLLRRLCQREQGRTITVSVPSKCAEANDKEDQLQTITSPYPKIQDKALLIQTAQQLQSLVPRLMKGKGCSRGICIFIANKSTDVLEIHIGKQCAVQPMVLERLDILFQRLKFNPCTMDHRPKYKI